MTTKLRVLLEVGTKGRRVVAGATDWPGLDRWGKTDDDALEKLASYLPRYADVAERAGMAKAFAAQGTIEVVERYTGSSSTDFWGVAHVPSETEREVLSEKDLERRLELLKAGWDYFDDAAARASEELRPQPRGGGRSRDEIIRHVYASERQNFWRKVGIREEDGVRLTPKELAAHRRRYLDAIRAYNAEGRIAGRSSTIQFLIRRTGHHVLDHAWEIEDRTT
ncbi:MAG TPA: hypothetical protein VEW95_03855 [Candidatus Limnocylindrales bacterium]|nr:hypothetical protein [Candidatus Limnocylindrales bacterium]